MRQCRAVSLVGIVSLLASLACGAVHINQRHRDEDSAGGASPPSRNRDTGTVTAMATEPNRAHAKETRSKSGGGLTVLFEDGRARMRSDAAVCRLRVFSMTTGTAFAQPLRNAVRNSGYTVTDRRSDGFDLEMRLHGVLHDCPRNNDIDGDLTLEVVRDGVLVEELTRRIGTENEEQLLTALVSEVAKSKRVADALKGKVVAITPTVTTSAATSSTPAKATTAAADGPLVVDTATSMLVVPLKPMRGVNKETCQLITNYMLSQLQSVKRLRTSGQGDIDAVLGVDKQKQTLGCGDVACMAEIGGALGVDLVMYGEIGILGSKYNLNVSAVRTADASVAARSSLLVDKTEDALADKVPTLVRNVIDGINTTAAASNTK